MTMRVRVISSGLLGAAVVLTILSCSLVKQESTPALPGLSRMDEHGVMCGPAEGDRRINIPDSAVSWANWEIPEYQDRQRFMRQSDGQYGPIACVVAADGIERIPAAAFMEPGGKLAAVIFVDGDPGGDPSYGNLRLRGGYHCLFLKSNASTGSGFNQVRFDRTQSRGVGGPPSVTTWASYIVPSIGRTCRPDATLALKGVRIGAPGMSGGDIPGVARFILDSTGIPGIGIRCLDAWCVVGLSESTLPSVAHPIPAAGPEMVRRLVFGWYDDQVLAVPRPGGTVGLGPLLRATIIPDHRLATYTMQGDFKNQWKHVAKVRFTGVPVGKYATKWHFLPNRDNTIQIRWVAPYSQDSWLVRINDTVRAELRVHWTPHTTAAFLASTARWAWKDVDEGGWIRCDIGCCEIEPVGTPWGM
ncbi:MAG: hypothetical protein ABIR92_01265 [Gemmatimonadaceae bacterium]